jgi:hypothetical protein
VIDIFYRETYECKHKKSTLDNPYDSLNTRNINEELKNVLSSNPIATSIKWIFMRLGEKLSNHTSKTCSENKQENT